LAKGSSWRWFPPDLLITSPHTHGTQNKKFRKKPNPHDEGWKWPIKKDLQTIAALWQEGRGEGRWETMREIMRDNECNSETNKQTNKWIWGMSHSTGGKTTEGSPTPVVKMANEIICDYVWDKLPISVTCSKWYIRKAPFVLGGFVLCSWVSASLFNKLASQKLWCPLCLGLPTTIAP
jgi:hypothetical protein